MSRILLLVSIIVALSSFTVLGEEAADKELAAIKASVTAGKYDVALRDAKAFATKHPTRKDLADALYEGGSAAAQKRLLDHAIGFYRLLVDKFPESKYAGTARGELAACYSYVRKFDKCIEQSKTNLKLEPKSPWAEYWQFLIAQSYFRLWKYPEAKAGFEATLAKYPKGKYAGHVKAYLGRIDPPWKVNENGAVAYSGKYNGDIRLQAAMAGLPKYVEEGHKMLKRRLGLDLKPYTNVVYVFSDAGNKKGGGLKATTRIIGINNKPTTMVRFYTEYVVVDQASYRRTITHEMKHAGFLGIMGDSYHDLPKWVREGLALWGSEDVDRRLQLVLSNVIISGKNPETALNGIDNPIHGIGDYMEDVLAFEWLASKNPENVKLFCKRLVKGEDHRKIWADLSGMSYADAMAQANAHCRHRVKVALEEGYDTFVQLRKGCDAATKSGAPAVKKWLNGGGKRSFENWLAANAGHPAEPLARFYLARALVMTGQFASGRVLLQKILKEDAQRCTLLDDAQFWVGVSYNYQRDHANSRAAFGVLLRDFTYSRSAKQVAGKFQPAGPVTALPKQ